MEEKALEAATAAARQAGELQHTGLNTEKHARATANRQDPMSVFARRLEEIIVAAITCSFPNHRMLHDAMIAIINR